MAWNDRIREASYTSPNGNNIVFLYEDVRTEFDKKTTAFNFPDADGTYVQDLGNTGRRFPLRIFLSGDDYDLQANDFINVLRESGIGRLNHPIYGVFDVVPFGSITRIDALKTEANQAVFEVTFWQTIGLIYPTSQNDPASNVLFSIQEFTDQTAAQFESIINLDNASLSALFQINYESAITVVSNVLRPISETQENVRSDFNTIERSINEGITTLIGDPLTLAFQTVELIKAPARAVTSISDRLDAYFNLADQIISESPSSNKTAGNLPDENSFYNADLFASSLIIGSVLSSVNNQFETKTDALETADNILNQFSNLQTWRDDNYTQLAKIDTGESYQKLQETVALAAGFLVEISFNLKQENRIILDRNRTIIDLSSELYGEIDNQLDFLINSNNLTGSEILELPKGKEIVFYV